MRFRLLLILSAILTFHGSAWAVVKTSNGGDWNTAGTWSPVGVPLAADDVILASGTTNMDVTTTINTLTIDNGAILDFPTNGLTLTVTNATTMNGASTITGNNNNRILSLLGDFNVPAGASASIGGIRVTQALSSTFNLGGTFTPTDNTGIKTFGNAIFSDGSLVDASVTETIIIAGNLAVIPSTPGLHSKIGRVSLVVLGTTTVTGYLEFANSGTGAKSFNNTITVAAGGTWDNIIGEDPIFNCSVVNDGVWPQPTGGNGRYSVNVAGTYTYSGTREIAMTRLRIQTNATVTNNGALRLTQTANVALTVNGGGVFNNGDGLAGALLTFTGYTDVVSLGGGGSVVNFANANNTVDYASTTNDQNVYSTTYAKLICSGGNTATVAGTTTVNESLTISGSTVVDVTGGTDLDGTGNLVMTGTSRLRLSSAGTVPALTGPAHSLAAGTTIEFNRAGVQTAASSGNYPYQNVLISGNAGSAVSFNQVSTIAGNLTMSSAGRFTNTANTPPLITLSGALLYASSATTTLNTNLNAGSVTISTGGFTYSNRVITLSQDDSFWSVTGAPIITAAGTAEVNFTAGLNQSISGAANPSFNILRINNSNGVTVNSTSSTINGNLILQSGMLITGNNVVIIPAAGIVTQTGGYVNGNLNKTIPLGTTARSFEVGTAAGYARVDITCTSVTTAGTLTVSAVENDHPEIAAGLIEPNNTVNRYWPITNNGIVFSAFSTGVIAATFNFTNADEDASLDNTAIIKWYNNSTLTWAGTDQFDEVAEQNPVMTMATNTAANTASFTLLNPAQLPSGQIVDFQIGEKIDPTFVYNRLTGAQNWNNLNTWIQQRTGVITLTNGSGTITGVSTLFQSELAVGDQIMLITDPATVYTITSIAAFPTQSLTVGPGVPGLSTSGGFGRKYIPGINSPSSDVDAVVIGNTNIGDATTTVTLDIDAKILNLDVGSTTRTTAQALTHQSAAMDLTVLANATVNQPGAAAINGWNINDGTADVSGDVVIGTPTSNALTRIARVTINTGTLSAGNLKFRPFNSAGRQVQTVLNFTGAGTINLHGALTFNGNRGTLSTVAGSIFNFDRTASAQTISVPSGSTAAWVYANIHSNNTSTAGAAFGFTSTATSVTGNVRVQTGLMTVGSFDIVGAAGSTFEVANGATFEMRSTANAAGAFPSGFGTISLGATSTVIYNQTGNNNPWAIRNTDYGNLIVGQNASIRNFELASATTNVLGSLTVGDGSSTPNLQATGAATLNVTGDITVNASSDLDASNITNINLGGNWTNDGTFTPGTNTVTFSNLGASALRTVGGTTADTFYNLIVNTTAATNMVQLSKAIDVSQTLTLTQGGLDLNSNTLSISRSATAAIVRTSGYVKSEDIGAPYGTLSWFINNSTGSFQYPFGKSATEYIPVILNVTGAGARGIGSGYVPISTYATAATNPPGEYPASVNNLNGTTGGASVTDRYWSITIGSTEFATTRPTATITFTALNSEKPSTWTLIGEPPTNPNQLQAQRWNTANYWDPAQTSPVQTYANDFPVAGTFQVGVPSVTSYSTVWTITDSSVPLPIELLDFTASVKPGFVELNWRTETETDNDFFVVQRTSDGEHFDDVTQLKGAGTSTSPLSYIARDHDPLPGRQYYRLRQTDFDGTSSYSKLVAVHVPDSFTWRVFPNPSDGLQVNIMFSSSDVGKNATVIIQDVNGKEMFSIPSIPVENRQATIVFGERIPAGIYLLTLGVEQQVSRIKLVVR